MFESPFLKKKVEFKKEDTSFRAQFLSGLKRVDDFFVDAIPSDEVKQLPVAYMYPVGLVVFIVLLGIFTGVFIPGEVSISELLCLRDGNLNCSLSRSFQVTWTSFAPSFLLRWTPATPSTATR